MSSEPLADRLRGRGMRMTSQRQLILDAVCELGHSTPEDVFSHVHQHHSGVNITTVYRALEVLEQIGLVQHSHVGHGPPTYHASDNADHVHVRCHGCGQVASYPLSLLADVAAQLKRETGLRLDAAHVALSGLCATCQNEDEVSSQ